MKSAAVKKWLIRLLKAVLVLAILRYLIVGVEWQTFAASLAGYGAAALAGGIALIVVNDVVQALRWRFLTRNRCSVQASFESIVVGGFLNVILPAKLGEVSRLIYLRNVYRYPFNYGVGAMVVERGADLFVVACFLAAGAGIATGNDFLQIGAGIAIAAILGTIFALKIGEGRALRALLRRIPLRFIRIYSQKIARLILRDLGVERTVRVLGYTLLLRIVYFLTVAFFINEVAQFHLTWGELFIVYLVSSIAWSIPLAPGGSGTFHAGMVLAMGWYGIAKEESLAIAVVFHLLLNLVPMLLAVMIILVKGIPLSRMMRMEEKNSRVIYEREGGI